MPAFLTSANRPPTHLGRFVYSRYLPWGLRLVKSRLLNTICCYEMTGWMGIENNAIIIYHHITYIHIYIYIDVSLWNTLRVFNVFNATWHRTASCRFLVPTVSTASLHSGHLFKAGWWRPTIYLQGKSSQRKWPRSTLHWECPGNFVDSMDSIAQARHLRSRSLNEILTS